jgi:tetratricopeptide (TPR) repeat protein
MVLAQLAPTPIPEAFLEALPDEWRSPRVRAALRSRHFVTSGGGLSFGVMQQLMADFLLGVAPGLEPDLLVTCRAIGKVITVTAARDPTAWALLNLSRPHAERVFERWEAAGRRGLLTRFFSSRSRLLDQEVLWLMHNVVTLLLEQALPVAAEDLALKLSKVARSRFGPDHQLTLAALNQVAIAKDSQGRWNEARALHESILQSRRCTLGPRHPDTLASTNNLALTLQRLGRHEDAMKLLTLAIDVGLDVGHSDVQLQLFETCAELLLDRGDLQRASVLIDGIVRTRLSSLGESHPDTLRSRGMQGRLELERGNLNDASLILRTVAEGKSSVFGPERPSTLSTLHTLGVAQAELGDRSSAERTLSTVHLARIRLNGRDNGETLRVQKDVAITLLQLDRVDEAETMLRDFCDRAPSVLGHDHPDLQAGQMALADVAARRGSFSFSIQLLQKVQAARKAALGDRNPKTVTATWNLMFTHLKAGEFEEGLAVADELAWLRETEPALLPRSLVEIRHKLIRTIRES